MIFFLSVVFAKRNVIFGTKILKHFSNYITALSYERNGAEFLFRRRGLDIEFYFGNEILKLRGDNH